MNEPKSKDKPFAIPKQAVVEAFRKVKANQGGPGVDGCTIEDFEADLRNKLYVTWNRMSSGSYFPPPVKLVEVPKPHGKGVRRLGVPTVTDRVVQASLKLVLEPIFEADFKPCSYGFRPNRRAQDAIAEIHLFTSESINYRWIFEADIKACLDAWSHCSFADCRDQNSWFWGLGSSIRRPFMRPVRVRTARSSPRFTRCNMVWRETPRARVA